MRILFVCGGNSFRSRLAEAYLKSKQIPQQEIQSCGTQADADHDGPITWWGQRVMKNARLIKFMARDWQKASQDLFEWADKVIFFGQEKLETCRQTLGFSGSDYQVWDIPDVSLKNIVPGREVELARQSDGIFTEIRKKVDQLTEKL